MYSAFELGIANAVTATVLAVIVWLSARAIRRPALVHALWVVVLLKLVTPPIVEFPIGMQLMRIAELADPSQLAAASLPTANRFLMAMLLAWSIGSLSWFVIQAARILFFWRLLSSASLAPTHVQSQTRRLAERIGIRQPPLVRTLPANFSPLLWAVGGKAMLLFPQGLLDRVDTDARATLLFHELAHLHRRDHWVRLLELVVTGLFWWHPLVWLARRQIEISEEQCCDAWVIEQFPARHRCYAEALLATIDFLCEGPRRVAPAASGLGDVKLLRRRLRMIMTGVAPKAMSAGARLGVLLTALLLLPLGPELFDTALKSADAALNVSGDPDGQSQ